VPGRCELPRTGPADAVGCYLAGTEQLGAAPATPLFWHLDSYATRAAAETARRGRGTVAEAHGRVWLFTIADAEWRPEGGQRVARVGPLPLTPGRSYAAHYIEGVVPPNALTPVHRHPGPEVWYILEGTNCLETPDGVRTVGAGESLIVPEGPPMALTGVGTTMRRTLALVVHDAAQPWTKVASDWTPKGACPR
jgi:quercetin dioxygenase-like cupin family protein